MNDDDGDGDDSPPSSPDLYCRESPSFLYDGGVTEANAFANLNNYYDNALEEEEHLQTLIGREIRFGFRNWVLDARLAAITWVLKKRTTLGFLSRTAYLAITYFDRFISLRAIPVNENEAVPVIRVLSVACLSLAAKMEETNIPSLSQYDIEGYLFEGNRIQRMELVVLGALEWRMNLITPFDFLDYFISKLRQKSPSDVKPRIERLLLSITTEINLMHHRPSAVAAAATLMALNRKLTREALKAKINSIAELNFLEIEAVFSCYNLLQQLKKKKPKEPKSAKTD